MLLRRVLSGACAAIGAVLILSGCAVPQVTDDTVATAPGQSITIPVLANDRDPNGKPLAIKKITSSPEKGTVIVNHDNTITYTPSTTASGIDTFDYKAMNTTGGASTGHVTVQIQPPAAQPVTVAPAPPATILAVPEPPMPPPAPPEFVPAPPMGSAMIRNVRVNLHTLDDPKSLSDPVRLIVRRGDEILADRTVGQNEAWAEDSERSFKLALSRPIALSDAGSLTLDVRKLSGGGPPSAWTLSANADADLTDGRSVNLLPPTLSVQLGAGEPPQTSWTIPPAR